MCTLVILPAGTFLGMDRIIRLSESLLFLFRNDGETRQLLSGAAVSQFLNLAFQVWHRASGRPPRLIAGAVYFGDAGRGATRFFQQAVRSLDLGGGASAHNSVE